jgi:hypothetical protein
MRDIGILNQFGLGGVGVKYRQTSGTTAQGFPILDGPSAPNLTQEEYENIPLQLDVKVRLFDLNNEVDLKEYTHIRDLIANKACIQLDRTKLISEDNKKISVHMEWAEVRGKLIPNSNRRP